jgi:hypothetical protein
MTCMDPVKIAGIKNWPTPIKVKDVRSFLGFCNFYCPFIRGFAHLARPLNELTRKDAEWSWQDRQQKVFDELKRRVTTEPVLAHPILTDPFELEVDASGFAMGQSFYRKRKTARNTPLHTIQKLSAQRKGTTTCMTWSCWQLSMRWTTGDHIWRDHRTKSSYTPTIKTSCTGRNPTRSVDVSQGKY